METELNLNSEPLKQADSWARPRLIFCEPGLDPVIKLSTCTKLDLGFLPSGGPELVGLHM